jgi:hypothetical protein
MDTTYILRVEKCLTTEMAMPPKTVYFAGSDNKSITWVWIKGCPLWWRGVPTNLKIPGDVVMMSGQTRSNLSVKVGEWVEMTVRTDTSQNE